MKFRIVFYISLAAALYSAPACNSPHCCLIEPPSLNITPEKTGIERQIIGDYMELEKDAWTVSSVKTSCGDGSSGNITGDPEMLKAEKVRSFHAGKLAEYKTEGAAGEGNNGFVSYIKTDKYEADPVRKKILLSVLEEENSARKIIFTRSLFAINGKDPSGDDLGSFGRIFADEQRLLAAKGEWIQENSGTWVRKK